MRSFKDTEGRDWQLKLDVAALEDVFDETKIDLGDVKAVEAVFSDSKSFITVLSILIRDQLAGRGLEERAVKQAFDADVFADAQAKLLEEVVFFIPRQHRPKAERLLAAIRQRQGKVLQLAEAKLDRAVEKILAGEMDKTLGLPDDSRPLSSTATVLPASAE